MRKRSMGIHHITAIVGHPQENVDFYTEVLGLRLIKKTVNFDDPKTYHFYFGDKEGIPGTVITFFPWPNGEKGKVGGGQVGSTSYAVPIGGVEFWKKRLERFDIPYKISQRFSEEYIQFKDPHGLELEIVETAEGEKSSWEFEDIKSHVAIKGFQGARLLSFNPDKTAELLENIMGYKKVGKDRELIRFKSTGSIGNIIDLDTTPKGIGKTGVGIVHHIALRAKDDEDQLEWMKLVEDGGYHISPIRDRDYFKSIYFREHGGNLFEIATDGPGFTIDESLEQLGQKLMLPSQYESKRKEIENVLIPIK